MKNNSIIAKRVTEKLLKPKTIWGLSSAGRASALQAEGHRFEPYRPHLGGIAQLARAHGSYPWCRGFESPSSYLTEKSVTNKYGILAQLGEHLPYKQRVIGSSPIGSIDADVAQLAEQLICNQQVIGSSPIIGFSRYKNYREICADSRVAKGDRL